jgi:hypothetical protein
LFTRVKALPDNSFGTLDIVIIRMVDSLQVFTAKDNETFWNKDLLANSLENSLKAY